MKLIRTLFQTTVLLAVMVVFSAPLPAQTDYSFAQPASVTDSQPAHLPAATILAWLGSGLVDGMVILLLVFLVGLTFWLAVPTPRIEKEVGEQPPVEVQVPPLRPIPQRITMF
jgi:hypothetical protein